MEMATDVEETLQPSALIQRLAQRRTEPLGIIDVRQPEKIYNRTAGWVAQRFALLDGLKFRYSGEDNSQTQSTGLLFATASVQAPAETSNDFSATTQIASALEKPPAPSHSSVSHVPSSTPEKFRISRRVANLIPESHAMVSPSSSSHGTCVGATTVMTKSERQEKFGSPVAVEMPTSSSRVTQMPLPMILPKRIDNAAGDELASEKVGENVDSARGHFENLPSMNAEPPRYAQAEVSAPPLAKIFRKPLQPDQSATSTSVESTEAAPGHTELVSKLTLEQPAGITHSPATVMAKEISPELSRPEIVWRKGINGSPEGDFTSTYNDLKAPLPLRIDEANGNAREIRRQERTESASTIATGSPASTDTVAPVKTKAMTQKSEIDLDRLTERVSRRIFRQLAVERERRGIGRWN